MRRRSNGELGTGLAELVAVWLLFLVAAAAVFVTYSRLPPAELYNTSVGGLVGGAGRTLVFVNYPLALVAIAIVLICADRLVDGNRRAVAALAVGAVGLCVTLPWVVDQGDLDARLRNVAPAIGVAIALGFTVAVRPSGWSPPARGDRLRVAIAAALLVLAIPWLFAEAGFYAPDPIYADERPERAIGEETLAAVHLGFHHGTAGVELALTALLLSRTLTGFRQRRLALVASGYLALMLSYGVALAAQDAWGEQVVKRGWTARAIPSVILPSISFRWLLILAVAAAIWVGWFRPRRD